MTDTEVRPTTPRWKRRLAAVVGSLTVVAACLTIRYYWGADSASAEPAETRERAPEVGAQAQVPTPRLGSSGFHTCRVTQHPATRTCRPDLKQKSRNRAAYSMISGLLDVPNSNICKLFGFAWHGVDSLSNLPTTLL